MYRIPTSILTLFVALLLTGTGATARQKVLYLDACHPAVVIASDDDASEYRSVFHFKNADLPLVFCGVYSDASEYGYPCANVTGMVAVVPTGKLIYCPMHQTPC
jgi:hypothetical protein